MHPVLFQLGPFTLYSYGTMLALAFLIATFLAFKEARIQGLNTDIIAEVVIITVIMAIIGSRIGFLIIHCSYFTGSWWRTFFAFRSGGLSFHGGLIGALLGSYFYTLYRRTSFLTLLDLFAPYIALGYGIARFGCLLNGCCYGKVTTVPWALSILSFDGLPRHPTQLYAAAAGFIIFLLIRALQKRNRFKGYLFLMFLLYYSIYRFIVEFFREAEYWGYLTIAQVFSLGAIALVLIILLVKYYSRRRIKW